MHLLTVPTVLILPSSAVRMVPRWSQALRFSLHRTEVFGATTVWFPFHLAAHIRQAADLLQ